MTAIESLIKSPNSQVFRRAKIKRMQSGSGLFESGWQDISDDVKTYGKITNQIDAARRNKFTFGNARLVMQNDQGKYASHENPTSLWYGYVNQQRTLVKIEAGFQTISQANGLIAVNEFPAICLWDEARWDTESALWDAEGAKTAFVGIISGDILFSDKNEVTLNIKPLNSIFQDFPARNLTGWTSTGMTASQFVQMVRDQTDSNGAYVFRPFFGDTTTNWDISTTSNVFSNLNTSTAEDVIDKNVWEIIEKLAEAENFVPYVTRDGKFKFISRSSVDTTTAFEFHGAGSFDSTYGQTIMNVASYAFRPSKYYSRVQIKYRSADTSTSYSVVESTLTVASNSNPWILGVKTLSIENLYIPTATVADTLAQSIFNEVSSFKKEIDFETSFVPHLDLFDRFSIHYDPTDFLIDSLWDQNDWAPDIGEGTNDLIWDKQAGDGLLLNGQEFKFISQEIDLDNFKTRIIAREV